MGSLKRRLDHSLTAQAVLIFLLVMGSTALLRRDEHPLVWVIQGAIYAAICTAFVAVQRRRTSRVTGADPETVAGLNRKIRHRDVPRAPRERAIMQRLVTDQLSRMERGGRWLPYWLGAMGLLVAGAVALGIASGSYALPLILAVGLTGFCCWVLWMRRRSLDRCRYMRSALQGPGGRTS
ncbi:hypothetical protein GCM10010129_79000 [Streptomyces fumigatiscleroticus]|nr:hypothetical protein GCM10010129_79000 [Streptomyces fumigatiscleroticus]